MSIKSVRRIDILIICDLFYSFIRKKFALPEDVEYFNIQLQMNYDLFDEYKEVERIIGTYISNFLY